MTRDLPIPDDEGGEMTQEEELELLAFEEALGGLLREDLATAEMPPELEARLARMTQEYSPDESKAWVFLAGFLVVAAGVWGAAAWTPLFLVGIAVFALVVIAADRTARRLRDRGLIELLLGDRN